jgi:hypothetical protein
MNEQPKKHTGGRFPPGVSGNPGGKRKKPAPEQPEGVQPENPGRNPDGTFAKGNAVNLAGKPKGARHRATLLAEALIDGQSEALIQRAVAMALGGDASVMRALLDRLVPPRRERPVSIELPKIETARELIEASSALMKSVAEGEIVPGEAASLSTLIANVAQAITTADLADRIAKLEEAQAANNGGNQ